MIGYLVNPLVLFLAVWATAVSLYVAGVFVGTFPSPHALTVGVLALNAITFSLGYLTWTAFKGLTPPGLEPLPVQAAPVTSQRIQRALTFTLLMGVFALLLILYRVAVIAARSHIGILDLLTHPALLRFHLVTFIEAGVSRVSLMVMLISLTSSLFAVGFVLLGMFLYIDVTARRYVYLGGFLLVGLVICLANLSRYDMTVQVMYVIFAYGAMGAVDRRRKVRRTVRDLLLPALAVVLMFVVVEVLLRKSAAYGQTERWRGVLFSFYWYVASPIAALNEFLAGFHGRYDLGHNTFFPFFKWLHRFHLVASVDVSNYGEFVLVPYAANAYTYLRNFYEDFGILGVAIIPYVLGWLMAAIKDRAGRDLPFLVLYVFLLVPTMLSFYSYPLLSSQFYLQLLFGFIFLRRRLPVSVGPGRSAALCVEQTA